jgi:hypothetical protein
VERAFACVFDVDDEPYTAEQLAKGLADFYVIVHTSFSATEQHPRWRVVVPTDRPMSEEEYARTWRFLAMRLEQANVKPHYGASSAAHAWAVPARPAGGFYAAHIFGGSRARIEEALGVIPPQEPLPEPEPTDPTTYDTRLARASKYLARMEPAISGSGGHAATMRAAVAMVRGFALQPSDALALLETEYNPRCQPAWSRWELHHKVRQAHQRGRMAFGALVNRRAA